MEELLVEVAKEKHQTRPEMGSSFVPARNTGCWETGLQAGPGDLKSQGDWEWQAVFVSRTRERMDAGSLLRTPEEVFIICRGFKRQIFFLVSVTFA